MGVQDSRVILRAGGMKAGRYEEGDQSRTRREGARLWKMTCHSRHVLFLLFRALQSCLFSLLFFFSFLSLTASTLLNSHPYSFYSNPQQVDNRFNRLFLLQHETMFKSFFLFLYGFIPQFSVRILLTLFTYNKCIKMQQMLDKFFYMCFALYFLVFIFYFSTLQSHTYRIRIIIKTYVFDMGICGTQRDQFLLHLLLCAEFCVLKIRCARTIYT